MSSLFHYPTQIKLGKNSLIEAWLEIRWKLHGKNFPDFLVDSSFPFALGIFYNRIKSQYSFREELDTAKAPEGMLPYLVQYRFRREKDKWPALQLGPGIATVNFTYPYSWEDFLLQAVYLRENLLAAYQDNQFVPQGVILRYRNAYPFDYQTNNLFEFLNKKLNTSVKLPNYVPGKIAQNKNPSSLNMSLTYNLTRPKGVGAIKVFTGINSKQENGVRVPVPVIIWDLEVASVDNDVPDIRDKERYEKWLEKAHSVIHEWFFSLIDDELLNEFNERNMK